MIDGLTRRSRLGGPRVLRAEYKICISVSASRYGKCSDVNTVED
jgi:hypothetical protein